jgi:hypothetical protein
MSEAPVDPYDAGQVARVVEGTLRLMGTGGVLDLLARLPGVVLVPAGRRGLWRPATPAAVLVGAEHRLTVTEPVVHEHTVGGVVLRRTEVPPGQLPGLVAGLVVALTHAQGSGPESGVVLSAAREVLGRL